MRELKKAPLGRSKMAEEWVEVTITSSQTTLESQLNCGEITQIKQLKNSRDKPYSHKQRKESASAQPDC